MHIIGDAGTDELLANGGGNTVLVLYNLLIGYANYRTLRLKSYASALWMATLVIIPCCSPAFVLGIPFGFWLLSILRDGDTMAAFEG